MQGINPTNLVVPYLKVKRNEIHVHFIVDISLSVCLSLLWRYEINNFPSQL